MRTNQSTQNLKSALKNFLTAESAGTQEEICQALNKLGYKANQTKISRLLRQLGAIKTKDEHGKITYSLAKNLPPPEILSPISNLVVGIFANETMVVVHTNAGAASLVARLLDYRHHSTEILGTIAGDDTIFITPKTIKKINLTLREVKQSLGFLISD